MATQRQPPGPPIVADRAYLERLAYVNQVSIVEAKGAQETFFPSDFIVRRSSTKGDLFHLQTVTDPRVRAIWNFGFANEPFDMFMTYTDASGNKCLAMVFRRPMRLQSGVKGCCCGCLGQEMQVETPDGTTIASIVEDNTTWGTSLTIRDASGMPILKVIGPALPPYCCCNCCCKCCYALATFKVKSMAGTPLGEIKTDGYHYVDLSFPTDLDVHLKGTLIGCGFLIWCMFHPDGCIMHACLELLVGCLLCNFFCQRYGRAFEIFT